MSCCPCPSGWELQPSFTGAEAASEGLWLELFSGSQLVGTKSFPLSACQDKILHKEPHHCLSISCKAQAVFQDRVPAGIERFRLWLPGVGAKRLWSLMWVTANAPQSWAHTWWGKSQVAGPPFWVVIPSLPHAQTLKAPELWIIDAGTGIIP